MLIMGIDPGPTETAACAIYEDYTIAAAWKLPNGEAAVLLRNWYAAHYVIEGMRGMGARVGKETFEAAYMVGRVSEIGERHGAAVTLYHRPEYLYPLCGGRPAKNKSDATLYKALLTRFGKDQLKPLVGTTDLRSAFAVAVWHLDKIRGGRDGHYQRRQCQSEEGLHL